MVTDTMRIAQQVQGHTLHSVRQGQEAAVTTAQALSEMWADAVRRFVRQFVPSVYGAGRFPPFDPSDIIDRTFDLGEQLLGVQRELAHRMIQAAVPALHAIEEAAEQATGQVDERDERAKERGDAEDDLPWEHGFIFRSPDGTLNACAQSLASFARLANLVDDGTWLYHLRRGDYSRWFQDVIQDEVLACETSPLEGLDGASIEDSRRHITMMIMQRYPLSA